jgi:chromosome segregation ATPase
MHDMTGRWSRFAVAATMLSVTLPGAVALAETQARDRPDIRSPELRARLHDGRLAMIRESLKLNDAQLKLWEPVEAQLRASFDARQKARSERRAARERGPGERPSLADRLDRMSQRMSERAERAKALASAFRPFYASLSDDQKAVAGVVMRQALRGHGGHQWHHGFMRRAAAGPEHTGPKD